MDGFKVPSAVPQDLQLIQDIIGVLPVPPAPVHKTPSPQPSSAPQDDNIDSSDGESDADSEKEVEADILTGIVEEDEDENDSM